MKNTLIGNSIPMADLSRSIHKAAQGNWTVLVQGESGTGKGVAAHAIHNLGKRAGRPFVMVNCGAIPDTLIESELFGSEAGAFTGATRQKKGKFEAADRGTLFLDEIGELSLASQTRLLHVLQDGEVERLGGEGRRISVDVRVIAATNRDLARMVSQGTFRQDLYFRLNVFPMRTPALRERPDDIPALALHFILKSVEQTNRRVLGVSPEVLAEFHKHPWPGNIRQLENVVLRAVAVGETERILLQDLAPDFFFTALEGNRPHVRNHQEAVDEASRQVCIAAFTAAAGNCAVAAQLMGIHRNSAYRLIRRHGLDHLLSA